MRALLLTPDGPRFVADYPAPVAGDGEALIRVSLAGICGTDLALIAGYADFTGVLGHEFVGLVEQADDAAWLGRRVVGEINLSRLEPANHAPERRVLGIRGKDGCFADYLTLPLRNLHPVGETISDEEAVFAEPLAAALHVADAVDLSAVREAAVLGAGRLGMLVAMALATRVYRPTVLARRAASLELPARLGLRTMPADAAAADSFDLVVDCTGRPDGLDRAITLCRPLGTVVLKSTHAGPAAVDSSAVVVKELRLVGSRCGDMAAALEALEYGRVDPTPLIDAVYPLDQAERALHHAARPGVRKVLLQP